MYQTALYNEHYFEVPMVSAVERFHCNSPYKKERDSQKTHKPLR